MTKFWTAPQLTLISRPEFIEPEHLKVDWGGSRDDFVPSPGALLAEYSGRLCYMSQSNPAGRTTDEYLENILVQGHGSVMEHVNYSILIEGVSRSLTHELVRHRVGIGLSQLSQRYVDESACEFVYPPAFLDDSWLMEQFRFECLSARMRYESFVERLLPKYPHLLATDRRKKAREAARCVLPNATETKLVWTANIRALRHVIALRGAAGADAEIRRWACAMLVLMKDEAPEFFHDMTVEDRQVLQRFVKV